MAAAQQWPDPGRAQPHYYQAIIPQKDAAILSRMTD
jgi:hypothetical protein